MNNLSNSVFKLIQYSLWGGEEVEVNEDVFLEMKAHAIFALPIVSINKLNMSNELREKWEKSIYAQIAYNVRYKKLQENLPITIPYVILKGTSAAKYYPLPICRLMGDIDIMPRREDYETACKMLVKGGFYEITSIHVDEFGRHRSFIKDGIVVEVHSFFSLLNEIDQAEYLDNLINDHISDTHILPDLINGLVILEHISQHLEHGIGLRHVLDWMMYVNKCLPDNRWTEFQIMVQKIGLESFAIALTRMCELYLGLPSRKWSSGIDEKICKQLMDYIMSCGNLGIKRGDNEDIVINTFLYARTPVAAFRLLQERGLTNWKAAQKYSVLRLFAWVYQLLRYTKRGLRRNKATSKIKKEYYAAMQRKKMFDTLGIKQTSKGHAIYKDGRYMITYKRP